MCVNCEFVSPTQISTPWNCDDYIQPLPQIALYVEYQPAYDRTLFRIEALDKSKSYLNMGYVFDNNMLASMSKQMVAHILVKSFQPFIQRFPEAEGMIYQLIAGGVQESNLHHSYSPSATKTWYKKYDAYGKYTTAPPPIPSRRPEVDRLPGLTEMVKYPGNYMIGDDEHPLTMTLERCIIRLNDKDKWTREQIADWLETLDVDITFRSEDADEV